MKKSIAICKIGDKFLYIRYDKWVLYDKITVVELLKKRGKMFMRDMILHHGSKEIVEFPEIRTAKFHKDFYYGFYCTQFVEQAKRWAIRFTGKGIINEYAYSPNNDLRVLYFSEMTEEWLDFIVNCRLGKPHDYDIVEGPMANDTIFNYVQNYVDGKISRAAFWELAKFKKPTHQISFHSDRALSTLKFLKGYEVYDEE